LAKNQRFEYVVVGKIFKTNQTELNHLTTAGICQQGMTFRAETHTYFGLHRISAKGLSAKRSKPPLH
jgi:hypothetical protein